MIRTPHIAGTNEKPKNLNANAVHAIILHEIYSDFFKIVQDNGHSEELEPEEARKWFQERGANMDAVEKALDHAWNFRRAEFYIQNPKTPVVNRVAHAPKI